MGWEVVGGCPPHTYTHMRMHTHACTCTHVHTYDIIGNSQGYPQWGLPFAIEIIMFNICMCVHTYACMCMHVHMCGGHPQPPHTPIHPPHTPIHPPHTPIHPPLTPRAAGSPKHQNSISLELIKIIQFCLKILYL